MVGLRVEVLKIFGIPVRIDVSWLAIALLVTLSLAERYFPARVPHLSGASLWTLGLIGCMGLFGSILVHEFAHALVARRHGVETRTVTLFLFGGVAELDSEAPGPRADMKIALAGPFVSFTLAGILFVGRDTIAPWLGSATVSEIMGYLFTANLMLGAFNLLPAFPLDGGRMLRSLFWAGGLGVGRATRVAAAIGAGLGAAAAIGGCAASFMGAGATGLWVALVGSFVLLAARSSYSRFGLQHRIAGQPVHRFMSGEPQCVPRHISIEQFVSLYAERTGHSIYPVTMYGRVVGAARADAARRVNPEHRASKTVNAVLEPVTGSISVHPGTDALIALERMIRNRLDALLVVQDDLVVGTVRLGDLKAGPGAELS